MQEICTIETSSRNICNFLTRQGSSRNFWFFLFAARQLFLQEHLIEFFTFQICLQFLQDLQDFFCFFCCIADLQEAAVDIRQIKKGTPRRRSGGGCGYPLCLCVNGVVWIGHESFVLKSTNVVEVRPFGCAVVVQRLHYQEAHTHCTELCVIHNCMPIGGGKGIIKCLVWAWWCVLEPTPSVWLFIHIHSNHRPYRTIDVSDPHGGSMVGLAGAEAPAFRLTHPLMS